MGGMCVPTTSDGGVVWFQDPLGTLRPVGPPPGTGEMFDNPGNCATTLMTANNPLFDVDPPLDAYTGNTGIFMETGFPLPPEIQNVTGRLVFDVGYDCNNSSCWDPVPADAGWTIDWVVVAPFPIPGG
jgi:hypothetical protein